MAKEFKPREREREGSYNLGREREDDNLATGDDGRYTGKKDGKVVIYAQLRGFLQELKDDRDGTAVSCHVLNPDTVAVYLFF